MWCVHVDAEKDKVYVFLWFPYGSEIAAGLLNLWSEKYGDKGISYTNQNAIIDLLDTTRKMGLFLSALNAKFIGRCNVSNANKSELLHYPAITLLFALLFKHRTYYHVVFQTITTDVNSMLTSGNKLPVSYYSLTSINYNNIVYLY